MRRKSTTITVVAQPLPSVTSIGPPLSTCGNSTIELTMSTSAERTIKGARTLLFLMARQTIAAAKGKRTRIAISTLFMSMPIAQYNTQFPACQYPN